MQVAVTMGNCMGMNPENMFHVISISDKKRLWMMQVTEKADIHRQKGYTPPVQRVKLNVICELQMSKTLRAFIVLKKRPFYLHYIVMIV